MHLGILLDGVLSIGKDLPVDEFPSSVSIVSKLFFCHTLDALRDASVALVKNLGEAFRRTKDSISLLLTCWLMSTRVTLCPVWAATWAIPAPIRPPPMTTTCGYGWAGSEIRSLLNDENIFYGRSCNFALVWKRARNALNNLTNIHVITLTSP